MEKTLYILGGAKGVGKTSFYEPSLNEDFLMINLPFYNVDLIVKEEFGTYNETNYLQGAEIYRAKIAQSLSSNESFMIESNLAKQTDFDWIYQMKKRGYKVQLYFLCTGNVEINIERVQKRFLQGGHFVDETIVRHRYNMSLHLLKKSILFFDRAFLLNSSTAGCKNIAEVNFGKLVSKSNELPIWATHLLYFVFKLNK